MTVSEPFLICRSEQLSDGGEGVRFEIPNGNEVLSAFAIRYRGSARAFLNRCAHVPVELDWLPGVFFDDAGQYLICATHGATYLPHDGHCVAGPCRGRSLIAVACFERDGALWAGRAPPER